MVKKYKPNRVIECMSEPAAEYYSNLILELIEINRLIDDYNKVSIRNGYIILNKIRR